ncbi:MAG TPA: VWA domain-containing protein [Pyrinomonadaceae bacterium]|nr:VWA domain-containing protein [Pyrinomonadaceae bacterium]
MLYLNSAAQLPSRAFRLKKSFSTTLLWSLICCTACAVSSFAQTSFERNLDAPERVEITIRNPHGRVSVAASEEQKRGVALRAESARASLAERDLQTSVKGGTVTVEVARETRPGTPSKDEAAQTRRRESERIDLFVRVPLRARVRVETEGGAVDISGNVEAAEVTTDTGTIRADVPLDSLKYSLQWTASRPRFYSEVTLPKIKERMGGVYEISGRFGDKKAKRDERIQLALATERGVILFGVSDPSMVPSDLRERKLTESALAIIRSGNEDLIDAIRKTAPRLVGDYTQTLPPRFKEPALVANSGVAGSLATRAGESLVRVNASVTDKHGRAIGGLTTKDFTLYENGAERPVREVLQTTAPFNLVLLLDVSGSVEERLDFIRKAALSFLNTTSAQDRVAIISFRDDVQLVSDFTTDRQQLARSIKKIQAGGGTALYDSLAYALVHTLKPLRGERTAIVILSDGDDNRSFIPFPAVLEAATESGALIYPLYIPSSLIPSDAAPDAATTLDPVRTRFLSLTSRAEEEGRRLASISGGVYYPITRLDQLQQAYDDVVTQLRTAYTITYASDTSERREARIRVRVAREDASVRLSPSVEVKATTATTP